MVDVQRKQKNKMSIKEIIFTVMAIILVGAFCFGVYGFIFWFYYKIASGAYHLLELLINKI